MKGILNKKQGITNDNLTEMIPELKKVIKTIPKDGKNNKEILHIALKKLGWASKDIQSLLRKPKSQASARAVSPSFKFYKPTNAAGTLKRGQSYKSVSGGSPGLGKKK